VCVAGAGLATAQTAKPPVKRPRPAASSPAVAKPSPDFDKLAASADAAREAGRLDEAAALYAKALALRPDWKEGLWYQGTIFYDLDRHEEARNAFRRLIAIEPKHGPAYAFKGLSEFQLRNYDRALDDLQRGGGLGFGEHKDLVQVSRYHRAIILTRMQQYELALNTLTALAEDANESARVLEAFGLAMLRMPLLPSELPGDRREMVLMAGRAAFHAGRRTRVAARRAFEELVARFPETPNVHYAYGAFLVAEEPDLALQEFKRELKVSPAHSAAMLQIAFEHIKRGDFKEALPYAEQATQAEPTWFPARKAFGDALLGAGDVTRAIAELEAGVKLAPDSPGMRFALARAYARAGRTDDAARERAEFLRLDKIFRTANAGEQSIGGITERAEQGTPP
jgi:tetratricopeptide (TPR) repeat protein